MIIVGIDTETTGLNDDDEVIEIGYVIYDTETNYVLSSGSELLEPTKWGSEAEKFHKIPESLTRVAKLKAVDVDLVKRISAYKPSVILAHNASFDYPRIVKLWPGLKDFEWLCTKNDLDHAAVLGYQPQSTRLMHLALEYGFYIIGWHRAMSDSEYVCKIASKHDLEKALVNKKLPKYNITAGGRYNSCGITLMKQLKFRWNDDIKLWSRDGIKQEDLDDIVNKIKLTVPAWTITSAQVPSRPY